MSTKILSIIGLAAVAVFAAAFFLRTPDIAPQMGGGLTEAPAMGIAGATSTPAASVPDNPATVPAGKPSATPTPQGYTLAQVAAHNNASSCWSAVNGKVYNLTGWINQHPGGRAAILSMCGRDGSAAFNGQHGGQGRPANELAGFYLAPLL
jgi:hypothetical protein